MRWVWRWMQTGGRNYSGTSVCGGCVSPCVSPCVVSPCTPASRHPAGRLGEIPLWGSFHDGCVKPLGFGRILAWGWCWCLPSPPRGSFLAVGRICFSLLRTRSTGDKGVPGDTGDKVPLRARVDGECPKGRAVTQRGGVTAWKLNESLCENLF